MDICPCCLNECDDDICWCGIDKGHHDPMELGHSFVPAGCTCSYSEPTVNETVKRIIAKFGISTGDGKGGKLIIPKGAKGVLVPLKLSTKIARAFPDLTEKSDGRWYLCRFPNYIDELLCDKSQITILS